MIRPPLPQGYILRQGTLIENFGTFADWTADYAPDGSITIDTEHFKVSHVSQSLQINANATKTMLAHKTVNLDLTNMGCIRLYCYIPDVVTLAEIKVRFENDKSGDPPRRSAVWDCSAGKVTPGWNILTMHRDSFIPGGVNPRWSGIVTMRVSCKAQAAGPTSVSFAGIEFGTESIAKCMINFDDAIGTEYSAGFDYLYTQKGKKGNIWVVPDWIDTPGYMTSAQLADVYAAGWALGNHTKSHLPHLDAMTKAEQKASINYTTRWLLARGYTRAAYHLVYAAGGYNADTLAVMDELGIKSGRLGSPSIEATPPADFHFLHGGTVGSITPNIVTVATVKSWIDSAVSTGSTVAIVFHNLVADAGHLVYPTDYTIADFQAIVDYAIQKGLEFVTIDEWYNGLTNPRYRSLPL